MECDLIFRNPDQENCLCKGQVYRDFLDYAFSKSDYFMLVYVNYYGKGYTKIMKEFRAALEKYKVKSRSKPVWPGVLGTYNRNTTYKIIFYRNDPEAKEILKKAEKLNDWTCPSYPQDLAFFKGNICWFYSVGHENLAGFINPTKEDIVFAEKNGLACAHDLCITDTDYYSQFNEKIEKSGQVLSADKITEEH